MNQMIEEYQKISGKKYTKVIFKNDQDITEEKIKIKRGELHVYAGLGSQFSDYFLQNIPKCKKFVLDTKADVLPDASCFTKVKELNIHWRRRGAIISPEYLVSLKDIKLVTGFVYRPEYINLDFTNMVCFCPRYYSIPISAKYIMIDRYTYGCISLNKLIERLPELPNLEYLTLMFIPKIDDLELLAGVSIKSLGVYVGNDIREDISCVIKSNLFEKIYAPRCYFCSELLENNTVMTICETNNIGDQQLLDNILARNKANKLQLARRQYTTKSARSG